MDNLEADLAATRIDEPDQVARFPVRGAKPRARRCSMARVSHGHRLKCSVFAAQSPARSTIFHNLPGVLPLLRFPFGVTEAKSNRKGYPGPDLAETIRRAGWRYHIEITPALNFLPGGTDSEFEALCADIEKHGVHDAVVVAKRGNATILVDGVKRLDALTALGEAIVDKAGTLLVKHRWLPSDQKPDDAALRINIGLRRQMTNADRRRLASDMFRGEFTHWSDNRIALAVGLDHGTVLKVRNALISTCEIRRLERTQGLDGRWRPAAKPPTPKQPPRCSFCNELVGVQAFIAAWRTKYPARICLLCSAKAIKYFEQETWSDRDEPTLLAVTSNLKSAHENLALAIQNLGIKIKRKGRGRKRS